MEPLRPSDPRAVGPWQLQSRIGSGGMGVVYYANRRGQKVALKIVRDLDGTERNIVQYFKRELANLRLVSGPSVAALVDADMEAASAWIAFEYIDGPNLKVFVDSNGPLLEDAWRKFAAALLKGISEVHARGVIHRDLKPSNIVIASTGPKLIDFGIAQALDDTPFTRTGMIVGTPTWMAPEQIDAMVVGKPADLFAAGSILLYAATGREPWGTGTTREMQARICRGQPDMGGLSAMQSRLISALLIKDPIKRATAEDAVRVLGGGNYRPEFPWRTVFIWTCAALAYVGLIAGMISFYLGWALLQPSAAQSASMRVTATGAAVPTVEPTAEALPTEELPTEEPSVFICVQLFDDLNGNGVLDAGEGQVKGGVFTITDTSSSNTLGTYTSGEKSEPYCFEKMQPANYRVAVQAPAGYLATTLLEWDLTLPMGITANLEFGAQLGGAAPTPTAAAGAAQTATTPETAAVVPTATKDSGRNGQDTETYADGTTYTGGFKDGKRSGQGTLTHADGTMYTGEWRVGMPNGQGTYTYADATTYSYTVMPGENLNMLAKRFETTPAELVRLNKLASTVVFGGQVLVVPGHTGEFKDGKRTGQGTYTYADGTTYGYTVVPGDSLSRVTSRFGTTVREMIRVNNLTNVVLYVGQVLVVPGGTVGYKDGKRSGQGTVTYADDSTYTGEWKDGKPNGLGIMKYRSGRTYIGVWNDGKLVP